MFLIIPIADLEQAQRTYFFHYLGHRCGLALLPDGGKPKSWKPVRKPGVLTARCELAGMNTHDLPSKTSGITIGLGTGDWGVELCSKQFP
jgi:hypothetical protein